MRNDPLVAAVVHPDSDQWIAAKEVGDRGEKVIADWCSSQGYSVLKMMGKAEFDLVLFDRDCVVEPGCPMCPRGTIEVKTDLREKTSRNVAVEVSRRGHPSGIVTTTAILWATVLADEVVIVSTKVLYDALDFARYREVSAGDHFASRVQLVPVDDLRRLPGAVRIDLRHEVSLQTLGGQRLADILPNVGCDGEAL